jgi:hypothetical protein
LDIIRKHWNKNLDRTSSLDGWLEEFKIKNHNLAQYLEYNWNKTPEDIRLLIENIFAHFNNEQKIEISKLGIKRILDSKHLNKINNKVKAELKNILLQKRQQHKVLKTTLDWLNSQQIPLQQVHYFDNLEFNRINFFLFRGFNELGILTLVNL